MDTTAIIPMETREQRLLKPLLEFFSHEANFKQFLDVVVLKERNIPLRVLDWFVTNYAKSHDTNYAIKRPNGEMELFRVYRSYRNYSKAHHKKFFDVYARGSTITLEYESPDQEGQMIAFETAICQLKFFRWAIENLILDYVETNFDDIYADMPKLKLKLKKNAEETDTSPATEKRKKKVQLSKSVYNTIHTSTPTTMTFSRTTA